MSKTKSTNNSTLEVFFTFLALGLTSFGGPAAHIGFFRLALVEKRKWLTDSQFSQLLALCQFIPGPASSQLGLLLGLTRAGWSGAFAAFVAFTLPSAILLFLLAIYLPLLDKQWAELITHGLKLIAVAVVAHAVLGMTKQFCKSLTTKVIALVSLGALLLFPSAWIQIIVIVFAATAGFLLPAQQTALEIAQPLPCNYSRRTGSLFLIIFAVLLATSFVAFTAPLIAILAGIYQAGSLVFGGGHVVLPLLEGVLVAPNWITADDFMAGYGAAQTVPGPLFTVAAYLGALLPEGMGGLQGSALSLMALFIPGFLLVLGIMPFWSHLLQSANASKIVGTINASVVGILAAALYNPVITSSIINWSDVAIAIIGFGMLYRGLSALWVVGWCLFSTVGLGLIL